jgi:uncharacterized peroxidase-related enzyme
MARLEIKDPADLAPEERAVVDAMAGYGEFTHQVLTLAHRPPILKHLYPMLMELKAESLVSRRHIELAIVAVSKLNECSYCVAHHGPVLEVEGMSAAGVDRLLDHEDHPELDEVDPLVVDYALRVSERPGRIRDGMFEQLKRHFSDAQVVELTWRIALCGAFNRFNDALQLEIEPSADA